VSVLSPRPRPECIQRAFNGKEVNDVRSVPLVDTKDQILSIELYQLNMLDSHCIMTGARVDASRTRLVLLIVGGQDRADEGGG